MRLTIFHTEKCTQVIKISDNCMQHHKTYGEKYKLAREIASDISNKNYLRFEISE